jgi:membrane protein DedA with SNARE-associated domain
MGKEHWLKRNFIPILMLLFVIAITVGLFFCVRNPEIVSELKSYGYFGAFLIGLIGNASVLLPAIVLPILTGWGVLLYLQFGLVAPIMVGLAGGAGAAIGELTGYMAGYSGRGVVERIKLYNRLVEWLKRWGMLAIFVLSLVPFFFDLAGIAAGALRFPLWKFILACWLGRTILYVGFVVLAALGWEAVLPHLG